MEEKKNTAVWEDLVKAQLEIGKVLKAKDNPYFKSKYVDINGLLAEVKPALNKHNFALLQNLCHIDGHPAMKTLLIHTSGEVIGDVFPLPEMGKVQDMGSAITYIRRYSIQSLLAIEAEDDDGNTASKAPKKGYVYPTAKSEGIDTSKPPFGDETPAPKKTKKVVEVLKDLEEEGELEFIGK